MDGKRDINNDMKFLAKSEIRLKILSELNKNQDNVRGLVKKTTKGIYITNGKKVIVK